MSTGSLGKHLYCMVLYRHTMIASVYTWQPGDLSTYTCTKCTHMYIAINSLDAINSYVCVESGEAVYTNKVL